MKLRSMAISLTLAMSCVDDRGTETVRSGLRRIVACPNEGEFPLRGGRTWTDHPCARLGASDGPGEAEPGSIWVVAGAPPGGDGSEARPFSTIAEALAMRPDARALALSAGTHPVRGWTVTRPLSVRGAGVGSTTLSAASSDPALTARGAPVALQALTLRRDDGGPAVEALVRIEGGEISLRDVRLVGGLDAIHGVGAVVRGEGVNVEAPARDGVRAEGGLVALENFAVRGAGAQGLRLDGAHFDLRRGAVVGCRRHGFVVTGVAPSTGGRRSCDGSEGDGPIDCLTQVTALDNHVAGVFLEGTRQVEARGVLAAGTRLGDVVGGRAGDGVVIRRASVRFDPELTGAEARGQGSAAVDNDRVGLLVQGAGGTVSVHGALLAANRGGGMLIGAGAHVSDVRESQFESNAVGGLMMTPGTVVGVVQCNGIVDTHEGSLETTTGTLALGDGLHINGVHESVSLRDNDVSTAERFGVLVNDAVVIVENNRGGGNRFGFGVYGGGTLLGTLSRVLGTQGAPMAPPPLLDAL